MVKVYLSTRESEDETYMHDVRDFVQVPTLGEHVATSPTSPRYKVHWVVHYGFLGSEFVYAEEDRVTISTAEDHGEA